MTTYLLIFFMGGLGCVIRYGIDQYINRLYIGTLIANLVGCLLIGFFNTLAHRIQLISDYRIALTVGLCGGLTTMSTFCNQSLQLIKNADIAGFSLYLFISIASGIALIWLMGYIYNE